MHIIINYLRQISLCGSLISIMVFVSDCSEPFVVRHQTDDVNDVGGIDNVNVANPDAVVATLLPRGD